jgi:hypothetical protein
MPKVMLNCRPNGRRQLGKTLEETIRRGWNRSIKAWLVTDGDDDDDYGDRNVNRWHDNADLYKHDRTVLLFKIQFFLDKTRCRSVYIDVSEEVFPSIFMVVEKRRLGRSLMFPSAGLTKEHSWIILKKKVKISLEPSITRYQPAEGNTTEDLWNDL